MQTVRIHATLGPDLLRRPELAPLLGQEVEIRVRRVRPSLDAMLDHRFVDQCRRREAAAKQPPPTLEDVRAANAGFGGIAEQIIADREDRG